MPKNWTLITIWLKALQSGLLDGDETILIQPFRGALRGLGLGLGLFSGKDCMGLGLGFDWGNCGGAARWHVGEHVGLDCKPGGSCWVGIPPCMAVRNFCKFLKNQLPSPLH